MLSTHSLRHHLFFSPDSRILKIKEPRLWEIIIGRGQKQTLLGHAIKILDRVDIEGYNELIDVQGKRRDSEDSLRELRINWQISRPYCPTKPTTEEDYSCFNTFLQKEEGDDDDDDDIDVFSSLNSLIDSGDAESISALALSKSALKSTHSVATTSIASSDDTFYSV